MKTENYIERFQKLTPLRAHLGNGGATGLDTYDNYMGEKPDAEWRILYTRNRESETITESNWEILEETFKARHPNTPLPVHPYRGGFR